MPKELLNHFLDLEGEWQRGQAEFLKSSNTVTVGGASVRIHETAVGGGVLLSPVGEQLSSYGSPEIYLKITFSNGRWELLSAPLGEPMEFENVATLELNILFLVGNVGVPRILYRAMINAHCIYERISLGSAIDSNLVAAAGAANPGLSYNETRAVDVTILSPRNLVVERMTLDGYRLSYGGAVCGARIYDTATASLTSASADVTIVGPSLEVPISVPISATLVSGRAYRVGFYVMGNPQQVSTTNGFTPATLPYTEASGLFRINSCHSRGQDAFPNNPNLAAPRVTIRTRF